MITGSIICLLYTSGNFVGHNNITMYVTKLYNDCLLYTSRHERDLGRLEMTTANDNDGDSIKNINCYFLAKMSEKGRSATKGQFSHLQKNIDQQTCNCWI